MTDDFGWNQIAGQPVEVVVLPGSHGTLIAPPFVSSLAAKLDRLLSRDAQTELPSGSAGAKEARAQRLASRLTGGVFSL